MKIAEFLKVFQGTLPLAAAGYAKDALGLQVGFDRDTKLRKILLAYEITDDVIAEAIEKACNLIISYHPLIFPTISAVTDSSRTEYLTRKLIKSDISLYVIHTALDTHPEFGTSRLMADALGIKKIRPLVPLPDLLEKIVVFVPKDKAEQVREAMWNAGAGDIGNYDECSFSVDGVGTFRGNEASQPTIGKPLELESVNEVRLEMICERWKTPKVTSAMLAAHPYEEVAFDRYPLMNTHPKFGMGTIGEWPEAKTREEVLDSIKNVLKTPVLRHNGVSKKAFQRVAMVGGAGMEYFSQAKAQGADVFITGDVRYHEFYRSHYDQVLVIDAGHAETECFVTAGMLKVAQAAANVVNLQSHDTYELIESVVNPNVVKYY